MEKQPKLDYSDIKFKNDGKLNAASISMLFLPIQVRTMTIT